MLLILKISFIILSVFGLFFIGLGIYAADGLFFAIALLFIIATLLVGLEIRKKFSNPFD